MSSDSSALGNRRTVERSVSDQEELVVLQKVKERMLELRDCSYEERNIRQGNLRHGIRRLLRNAWDILKALIKSAGDITGSGRVLL
jgi:hypothetical protein